MRQLTSLDAQFLALENARQTGHVGSLTVFDTESAPNGDLTVDNMMELLAARLHLLPPLRWRLVETPFGLDYPHWVDDPHFDLEFHVREVALPAPGNDEQLAEQVQRLHSRLLDRIGAMATGFSGRATRRRAPRLTARSPRTVAGCSDSCP